METGGARRQRPTPRRRLGYRSGHDTRSPVNRGGGPQARVPQEWAGRFPSGMFTPNERSENALVAALMATDVQGGSTCRTKASTGEASGHEFSASAVIDLNLKQLG